MSACCPPGSAPAVANPIDYVPRGERVKIDEQVVYVVDNRTESTRNKAVVVLADIFGMTTSRHVQVCDELASRTSSLVVMPDFFFGEYWKETWALSGWAILKNIWWFVPYMRRHKVDTMTAWYNEHVSPYLKERGIERVGCYGMCFGAFLGLEMAGRGSLVKCVAAGHPSVSPLHTLQGLALSEMTTRAKTTPFLLMPGSNDPASVRSGGVLDKQLDNVEFLPFDDVVHGWTNRGDVNDAVVSKRVVEAFDAVEAFFEKNLV